MSSRRAAAALTGLWAVGVLALSAPAWADTTVHARIEPQNGSGVSGSARLTLSDAGDLVVDIHTKGLMPGPHAQHIHGSAEGGHFTCASMSADADDDGVITNEEATGEYGTITLALTTRGGTTPADGLALDRMPVADESGKLDYHRTIAASALPRGFANHLAELHIVQHGIDVNDNNRYDLEALGESTFARNLGMPDVPEEATNPAACGVVTGAAAPMPPHGGVETGGGATDVVSPWSVLGATSLGAVLMGLAWRRARDSTPAD
jgi:hypothetical protein